MDKKEFSITLTVDELNQVFGILAEAPWKIANPIMNKIQAQVTEQSQVAPAETEEVKAGKK